MSKTKKPTVSSKYSQVKLGSGETVGEYILDNLNDTDEAIASYLTENGFEASEQSVRSFRRRNKIKKPQNKLENMVRESVVLKGDTQTFDLHNTRISTQEEFIKHYNIDLREWRVDKFTISYHEMPNTEKATGGSTYWKRKDGQMKITPLTHIKAEIVRRKDVAYVKGEFDHFIEEAKRYSPKYKPVKYPKQTGKSGNEVEISLADHHFGKLAWHAETGGSDWDVRIAEAVHDKAVDALIQRTLQFRPERYLLVVGHDLFNSDNAAGTTTLGTPQNNDSRIQKVYWVVQAATIRAIDKLRLIAPVDVVVVPGNHDQLVTWTLGQVLSAWYRNDKSVTVDNSPNQHKFHEWGSVGLMFIHGDKGKFEDFSGMFAAEHSKMWGRTTYREVHSGDKHHIKALEKFGATVRILPSMTPPDAWHAGMGYITSVRRSQAFVWNKQEGLIGDAFYTVPEDNPKA